MGIVREVYRGRLLHVQLEAVKLPNGVEVVLEMVRHPGAAAVVPLGAGEQVVLVRQFRHAAGDFLWEVPAGVLRHGEEPRACAARELEEETGLVAGELLPLGTIFPSPGFCDEKIHVFLARDLSPGRQQLERDEVLTVRSVPFARAVDMIAAGEIQDAKTVAALHLTAAFLARGPEG